MFDIKVTIFIDQINKIGLISIRFKGFLFVFIESKILECDPSFTFSFHLHEVLTLNEGNWV